MKSVFFIFLYTVFSFQLFAQTKQYTVSGNVSDEQGLPVAYASVTLKAVNDSLLQGDLTDEQGKFNIQNVSQGKYLLRISFVGYQTYSQEIEVTGNIELSSIRLPEGLELDEVVISAQRKPISYEKGKIILTVENSPLADLPTATDVLSFVPGVNIQGNAVSVIGKGKALIFIDGKEVKSADRIESLQPETIKSITLDRNPSAKYDASYYSVIHITTKRNLGKDFSAQYIQGGAVSRNFGHSETVNLNHTSRIFNNFLSCKFKNSKNTESANTYQKILSDNNLQTNGYDATMQENDKVHSLTLGSSMKLNSRNTMDIQYFFNGDGQNTDIIGWETMEGIANKTLNVNRTGKSKEQDHTVNLSYLLEIDSIRSLQFFGDYTHLKNASVEQIISGDQVLSRTGRDTLDNRSIFDAYSLRAEYSAKWPDDYDWMLGAKYSVIQSNARSGMNGNDAASFFNNQSALTESNMAFYTTVSRQFDPFYTELGLRAEFTRDKYRKNESPVFDKSRNSAHFFPSFLFNYDFSDDLQLNLNYASKIQRPSFSDLDPSLSYLSSVLYSQGNPELKPMVEHTIELGSVINRKLNLSAAYKIRKNMPAYRIEPDSESKNILLNRPINIAQSSMLDFTATYTLLAGSLTSNLIGNFSVPFVKYPYGGKTEKNNIPLYQFITMSQYSITPMLFLFGNFGFSSKYSSVNTVISPSYRLTTGVNWVLMRGKVILTLFGNDLLHKSEPAIESRYGQVEFGQNSDPDTRMVGLTVKVNFNGFKNKFRKSDSNQSEIERIKK